ncbi:YiaAB two helix domain protein [Gloeothece citriformis PCC 7424]|uniref:YiaAB two helix domain protein n=1 Tax=Gloeothece citriformis (strain PCC 7424) TaxID=65393 RepID=B7KH87_GLOC7|nr:YiaA/YiaB family inner membrane protein [Gloeothece citriformis]ACK69296.1 YiaAB two helix domain protein [Gloeothece citriformis PCC 7424]
MAKHRRTQDHSGAWVIQTWLSFIISVGGMTIGIIFLPVDAWVKGYMGMGLAFSIGSTISLTKTQRDLYEGEKLTARIEEAKVEKILSEHNTLS